MQHSGREFNWLYHTSHRFLHIVTLPERRLRLRGVLPWHRSSVPARQPPSAPFPATSQWSGLEMKVVSVVRWGGREKQTFGQRGELLRRTPSAMLLAGNL
jgi:hypothetical protein